MMSAPPLDPDGPPLPHGEQRAEVGTDHQPERIVADRILAPHLGHDIAAESRAAQTRRS